MPDSPAPGRHRGRRAARRRRRSRGLVAPVVSALSVVLAIGPVVWLMSDRDGQSVADGLSEVLDVSQDDSGPAGIEEGPDQAPPGDRAPGSTPSGRPAGPGGPGGSLGPTGSPAVGTSQSTLNGLPVPAPTTVISSIPGRGLTTITIRPSLPPSANSNRDTVAKPPAPSTTSSRPPTAPRPPTSSDPSPEEPPTSETPPPVDDGTNAQEREVLSLTNAARDKAGCGPLKLDDSLVRAAGQHASDMVRRNYLDHTNPDGQGPGDRIAAAGFSGSGWGENIAAGYSSAEKVVAGWMKSEGHRKNILNCQFNRIGVGYDPGQVKPDWGNGSWVQDFGRVS